MPRGVLGMESESGTYLAVRAGISGSRKLASGEVVLLARCYGICFASLEDCIARMGMGLILSDLARCNGDRPAGKDPTKVSGAVSMATASDIFRSHIREGIHECLKREKTRKDMVKPNCDAITRQR